VARQVQRIALSLFTWTQGRWSSEPSPTRPRPTSPSTCRRPAAVRGARLYGTRKGSSARSAIRRAPALRDAAPFDLARVTLSRASGLSWTTPVPVSGWRRAERGGAAPSRGGSLRDDRRGLVETERHPQPAGRRAGARRLPRGHRQRCPPGTEDPTDRILRVFETLPRLHTTRSSSSSWMPRRRTSRPPTVVSASRTSGLTLHGGDVRLDSALDAIRARRREAYETLRTASVARPTPLVVRPRRDIPAGRRHRRVARGFAAPGTRGERLLQRGERDAAVSLLLRAVDADPRSGRCAGSSPWRWPTTEALQQAERHFRVALDLDPATSTCAAAWPVPPSRRHAGPGRSR